MTEYFYTPPSEVFQFEDVKEILGVRDAQGHVQTFATCKSREIARFVMDACNSEINRRQNMAEAQYERQQEEGFRGGEAASALAEEQARVQREFKR